MNRSKVYLYSVLSLLLTASAYAKFSPPIEECFTCPNIFDPKECPCKIKDLEMSFKTCLTFDQVLIQPLDPYGNPTGPVSHRDSKDRPGLGPDECHGTFELCFNKSLTKAAYRMTIFNANKNGRNPNEIPQGMFLLKLKAHEAIVDLNPEGIFEGLLTRLCARGFVAGCFFQDVSDCFCCVDEITNADLVSITPAQTIAGLYKLVRKGQLAVVVGGSGPGGSAQAQPCSPYLPFYDISSGSFIGTNGGLIRGQIWACNTGCQISNTDALSGCTIS